MIPILQQDSEGLQNKTKQTAKDHSSGNIKPWEIRLATRPQLLCLYHPRNSGTSSLGNVTIRGLLSPSTSLLAPDLLM